MSRNNRYPEPLSSPNRDQPPIEEIYRIAEQYSRRPDEADDLVQDLLLEAVKTGRDFSDAHFMAWGRGYLRNRAAFIARTEGRRRKREAIYCDPTDSDTPRIQFPEEFIIRLRPSLRIVARLVNCGLNRKEILYLLHIADTALRQRLTALRREWQSAPYPEGLNSGSGEPDSGLQNGLIRRSLRQVSGSKAECRGNETARIVGSHDPDGHLFTIRSVPAHKTDTRGNNSDKEE